MPANGSGWLWVDVENTPHVLFLAPLVEAMRGQGAQVRITLRRQAQTVELSAARGLVGDPIGTGDRVGTMAKTVSVLTRSWQLRRWATAGAAPDLLLSSSRTACLAAATARIRSVAMLDYEHAEHSTLARSEVLWFPDVLRDVDLPKRSRRVAAFYPGLKENLYLDLLEFDRAAFRLRHAIPDSAYLVISRPPADGAHYATDKSWLHWHATMTRLAAVDETHVLVMPRTARQRATVEAFFPQRERIRTMKEAIDGPEAVASADLVLGGGGTINREAAVLGTPVWSVFAGPRPQIDEVLRREGRLEFISTMEAATSMPLPRTRLARRGPYPAGLRAIVTDLQARLLGNRPNLA